MSQSNHLQRQEVAAASADSCFKWRPTGIWIRKDTQRRKVFAAMSSGPTSPLATSDKGRHFCCHPLKLPGNKRGRRWQRRVLKPAIFTVPKPQPTRSCQEERGPREWQWASRPEQQGHGVAARGPGEQPRFAQELGRGPSIRFCLRREQIHRLRERPQRLRGEGNLVSHGRSRFKGESARKRRDWGGRPGSRVTMRPSEQG